jgi:N-acetylglucosaminyldiphosphoundecaprenol N-acetyl-beta-D-mannosaminyltransferase
MRSVNVLGTRVDVLTRREVEEILCRFLRTKKAHIVLTTNVEMVYAAAKDSKYKKILNKADLSVVDSVGIAWAAKRQGVAPDLYPGIEIVEWLLRQNVPVYMLGTRPEILAQLRYPSIVGTHHGFFTERDIPKILADIKKRKPKVLLVGLGAGKQDYWLDRYKHELNIPIMIGVGGAIDVLAGVKKRAPKFFRSLRLEWLYRLITEPTRIGRQINLIRFVWQVLKK